MGTLGMLETKTEVRRSDKVTEADYKKAVEKFVSEERPVSNNKYVNSLNETIMSRARKPLSFEDAVRLKKIRVPLAEGLPLFAGLCLLVKTKDGNNELLTFPPGYVGKNPTHNDILRSWKSENPDAAISSGKIDTNELEKDGIFPHAYIVESTVGRELIITDEQGINDIKLMELLSKIINTYGIVNVFNATNDRRIDAINAFPLREKQIDDYVSALSTVLSPHKLKWYREIAERFYLLKDPAVTENPAIAARLQELEEIANKIRRQ